MRRFKTESSEDVAMASTQLLIVSFALNLIDFALAVAADRRRSKVTTLLFVVAIVDSRNLSHFLTYWINANFINMIIIFKLSVCPNTMNV
ncbi:hypothetical protein Nepgr_021351 [Nepenthes gracilis]|uniref:Uncharacterized protein n=1 Tax=Nepenthes gracilis TaxID=150966 RepID=A0AAD3SYH0_NEPGR|nr:hypothetical protein Nepgr_021351 [Nepenthes gracilis]